MVHVVASTRRGFNTLAARAHVEGVDRLFNSVGFTWLDCVVSVISVMVRVNDELSGTRLIHANARRSNVASWNGGSAAGEAEWESEKGTELRGRLKGERSSCIDAVDTVDKSSEEGNRIPQIPRLLRDGSMQY